MAEEGANMVRVEFTDLGPRPKWYDEVSTVIQGLQSAMEISSMRVGAANILCKIFPCFTAEGIPAEGAEGLHEQWKHLPDYFRHYGFDLRAQLIQTVLDDLANRKDEEELGEPTTLEVLGNVKPFEFVSQGSWKGQWVSAHIDEGGRIVVGLKGAELYGKPWEGKVAFNIADTCIVRPVVARQ